MPKLKTRKSVVKRFKLKKSGVLQRKRSAASHNLTKKSSNTKRQLRKPAIVGGENAKKLRKMLYTS